MTKPPGSDWRAEMYAVSPEPPTPPIKLPPLEPAAFLRWLWERHGGADQPLTVKEWAARHRCSVARARACLVTIAASTRFMYRLDNRAARQRLEEGR